MNFADLAARCSIGALAPLVGWKVTLSELATRMRCSNVDTGSFCPRSPSWIAPSYRISSAVAVAGRGRDRLGFLLCIAIDSEKIEQVVTAA
jgi:hypothetical protein